MIAAYEAALAEAREGAQSLLRQSAEELAEAGEAQQHALSEKLAGEVAAAEARIAASKTEALEHLRQVASDTARAAVGRLIGAEVGEAEAAEAVAAAAKEKA